ncbi:MAG TPA: metallophosphoesterase [Candidatus Nanoarchaeia archaeon]|nr:metallophosphoesterase [Candidatus Nanoarchaeia archaeon]
MDKKEVINFFLEREILLDPDFLNNNIIDEDITNFYRKVNKKIKNKPLVLGEDLILAGENQIADVIWSELDRLRVKFEKGKDTKIFNPINYNINSTSEATLILQQGPLPAEKSHENSGSVIILKSYAETHDQKRDVNKFVSHFKARYESLKKILLNRQELQDSISITRLTRKQEGEAVSVIGLVLDKKETKNGNIKLTIEDSTSTIDVLITKTRQDAFEIAKDIVLDEVIGISGIIGNKILFCNSLYFPDIPISHELKKSKDEAYAVFISDIHFGIKNFLREDFMKFVLWISGEYGTEQQREIAKKVRYLFITGDVVEGVGIYPGQEEDLEIKDIYQQYEEATKYLSMIPKRIKIIICGGNHDAMRISEPQPPFDPKISKGFYEIPNMIIVSNPAMVNIHSSEDFSGFDVLVYHGFSFPFFADNVTSLRENGGLARCDLIMKFLLQRRHLAPSHNSNLYIPNEDYDPLVIEKVPDLFLSGHVHQITVGNYRNISLINSSCWVVQSEDNAKRGIIPHPAKIPIMNLKTREVKIMNFLDDNVKVLYTERLNLK